LADRRQIMLAHRSADEQIDLLLLDQAETSATTTSPTTSRIPRKFNRVSLTHAKIAVAAAMSRPHMSMTLGRFQRKNLIRYQQQESIFVDMERLQSFLDQFEPSS